MVFLIQNTQNRDTQALQLKLDELIRATRGARNLMLALDKMDDDQLKRLQALYEKLGEKEKAERSKRKRASDDERHERFSSRPKFRAQTSSPAAPCAKSVPPRRANPSRPRRCAVPAR